MRLIADNPGSSIYLNASIGGGSFTRLEVGVNGDIMQTSGIVSGNDVQFGGGGSSGFNLFGTAGSPIHIAANLLTVIGYSSAYFEQTGPVSLGTIVVSGTFQLASNNTIDVGNGINASNIQLQTTTGDINIYGDLVSTATSGTGVKLSTLSGKINEVSATIRCQDASVFLSAETGSLGTALNPLTMQTGALSLLTSGGTSAYISNTGSPLTIINTSSASDLTVTNDADIIIGNTRTDDGSLTFTTSSGGVFVLSGALATANNGNLTLNTTDTLGGIGIGTGATLGAYSVTPAAQLAGLGQVYLIVGPTGTPPTNGTTTSFGNVTVNSTAGGTVYQGTAVIGSFTPNSTINVDGTNSVVFDGGNVTIGSSATINAGKVNNLITSLDLTDPTVVQKIQTLQASKVLGGDLSAGTVTFTPGTLDFMLTAENIPVGSTVTMLGFSNPLAIKVGAGSSSQNVVINGAQVFSSGVPGKGSSAKINISGPVGGAQPGLLIGAKGILSSDGDLTLSTTGTILNNGRIQTVNGTLAVESFAADAISFVNNGQLAGNNLFLQTVSSTGTGGSIINNGQLIGNTFVSLLASSVGADVVNQGSISSIFNQIDVKSSFGTISGAGTFSAPNLFLTASGPGDITVGSVLTAPSAVTLQSQFGSIGTSKNNIIVNTPSLTVRGGNNAFITSNSAVTIESAFTTGDFYLSSKGAVITNGTIGGGNNVGISTTQGDIILNNNVNANISVTLSAGGFGNIRADGNLVSTTTGKGGTGGVGGGGGGGVFSTIVIFAAAPGSPDNGTGGTGLAGGNNGDGTSTINAQNVFLLTNAGNIGGPATPIATNTHNLSVTAGGTGNAVIENAAVEGIFTLKDSSANSMLSIRNLNLSSMEVAGKIVTRSGGITLLQETEQLKVLGGATIVANQGTVVLQNKSAKSTVIYDNASISSISNSPLARKVSVVGNAPPGSAMGQPPLNAVEIYTHGGRTFFNNGVMGTNSPVTLIADAGTIVFDVGAGAPNQIQVGGATLRAIGPATPPGAGGGALVPVDTGTTGSSPPGTTTTAPNMFTTPTQVPRTNFGGTILPTDSTPQPSPYLGSPKAGSAGAFPGVYDPVIITDDTFDNPFLTGRDAMGLAYNSGSASGMGAVPRMSMAPGFDSSGSAPSPPAPPPPPPPVLVNVHSTGPGFSYTPTSPTGNNSPVNTPGGTSSQPAGASGSHAKAESAPPEPPAEPQLLTNVGDVMNQMAGGMGAQRIDPVTGATITGAAVTGYVVRGQTTPGYAVTGVSVQGYAVPVQAVAGYTVPGYTVPVQAIDGYRQLGFLGPYNPTGRSALIPTPFAGGPGDGQQQVREDPSGEDPSAEEDSMADFGNAYDCTARPVNRNDAALADSMLHKSKSEKEKDYNAMVESLKKNQKALWDMLNEDQREVLVQEALDDAAGIVPTSPILPAKNPFALPPETPFVSKEAAVRAAANSIFNKSVRENTEYSTVIYEIDEKNSSGETQTVYHYMKLEKGHEDESPGRDSFKVPEGGRTVATFHTHGAYSKNHYENVFSDADMSDSMTSYMVTPGGEIKKYVPEWGRNPATTTTVGQLKP